MTTVDRLAAEALRELEGVFSRFDPARYDELAGEVLAARRIVCFGLGREGLMMRAFAMRLMHLGLDAHVAGDVTAPPVGHGDLLLLSSGPGDLTLAGTMIALARRAGARIGVLTAQPDGPDPNAADFAIAIPAQTMADDRGGASILPMGTAFEIALLIYLDLVAVRLRERTGQSLDEIRARHANLE